MTNLDIFLIDYEIYKSNSNWWLEIIEIFLKPGLSFIASFEKDYTNILEKLNDYGSDFKISDEKNFIRVEGILDKEMIRDFKESYKVLSGCDIDYYSPFISLEIADNYCSGHYGREVYLTSLSKVEFDKVMKIINPLREYFKIDII